MTKLWNGKPVPFNYKIPTPNVCLVKTKRHIVPQETTDTERHLSWAAVEPLFHKPPLPFISFTIV